MPSEDGDVVAPPTNAPVVANEPATNHDHVELTDDEVYRFLITNRYHSAARQFLIESAAQNVIHLPPNKNLPIQVNKGLHFSKFIEFIETKNGIEKAEVSTVLFPLLFRLATAIKFNGNIGQARDVFNDFKKHVPSFHFALLSAFDETVKNGSFTSTVFQPYLENAFQISLTAHVLESFRQFFSTNSLVRVLVDKYISLSEKNGNNSDNLYEFHFGCINDPHELTLNDKFELFCGVNEFVSERKKKKETKEYKVPPPTRVPYQPLPEAVIDDRQNFYYECTKDGRMSKAAASNIRCIRVDENYALTCGSFMEHSQIFGYGTKNGMVELQSYDGTKFKKMDLEMLQQYADVDIDDRLDPFTSETDYITFKPHRKMVTSTEFVPDRRFMLTAGMDRKLKLFNIDAHTHFEDYYTTSIVEEIKASPKGYFFATRTKSDISLYALDRTEPIRTYSDSFSVENVIDFHPNGNYILSGGDDRFIRMWDVAETRCVRYLTGHSGGVRGLKTSPDGRYCVSVDDQGAVIVWDIGMQKVAGILHLEDQMNHNVPITFAPDASMFAIAYPYDAIQFYSLDDIISMGKSTEPCRSFNMQRVFTRDVRIFDMEFAVNNELLCIGQ